MRKFKFPIWTLMLAVAVAGMTFACLRFLLKLDITYFILSELWFLFQLFLYFIVIPSAAAATVQCLFYSAGRSIRRAFLRKSAEKRKAFLATILALVSIVLGCTISWVTIRHYTHLVLNQPFK